MGLKKYSIFSILLIVLITGYTYSIQQGSYEVKFMDASVSLPIFVWIALPMFLLFMASLAHMLFYEFKLFLQKIALKKDEENTIELIKNNLLHKNEIKIFKTKFFQDLSTVLSQIDLTAKNFNFNSSIEDINIVIKKIEKIENGEYLTSKELKLDSSNELMVKNDLNKLNNNTDYCLEILKRPFNHTYDVIKKAYFIILSSQNISTIKKILPNIELDKEMVLALFKQDCKEENFLIQEEIIKYLTKIDFSKSDFLDIAKLYKGSISPDDLLKIFEEISNINELALDSYLYVLFEYEMLDKVREIFASSSTEEFLPYRILLELKDSGKKYTLDSLCYYK